MKFTSFLVTKNEHLKNPQLQNCEICCVDINLWFRNNSVSPSSMNEVRQFIFEEWLYRKIYGFKNKINTGCVLVIIFENPNESFISLLNQKISQAFEIEISEVVLVS